LDREPLAFRWYSWPQKRPTLPFGGAKALMNVCGSQLRVSRFVARHTCANSPPSSFSFASFWAVALTFLAVLSSAYGHVSMSLSATQPTGLSPYSDGLFTVPVTMNFVYNAVLTPEQAANTTYEVQCAHAAVQSPASQKWTMTVASYATPLTTTLTLDARLLVPKPGDALLLPAGMCSSAMINVAKERSIVKSPDALLQGFAWGPVGFTMEFAPLTTVPTVMSTSILTMSLKFTINTYHRIVSASLSASCGFGFSRATVRATDLGASLAATVSASNLSLVNGDPDAVVAMRSFTVDGVTVSTPFSNLGSNCFSLSATGRDGGVILPSTAGPAAAMFLPAGYIVPTLVISTARLHHISNIFDVDIYTRATPPAAATSVTFTVYMTTSALCPQALFTTAEVVTAPLRLANEFVRDHDVVGCSTNLAHPQGTPSTWAVTTPGRASIAVTCPSASYPTWLRVRVRGVMSEAASVPATCWTIDQQFDASTVIRADAREAWVPLAPSPGTPAFVVSGVSFGFNSNMNGSNKRYVAGQLWTRPEARCGAYPFANVVPSNIYSSLGLTGGTSFVASGVRVFGISNSTGAATSGFQLYVTNSLVSYPDVWQFECYELTLLYRETSTSEIVIPPLVVSSISTSLADKGGYCNRPVGMKNFAFGSIDLANPFATSHIFDYYATTSAAWGNPQAVSQGNANQVNSFEYFADSTICPEIDRNPSAAAPTSSDYTPSTCNLILSTTLLKSKCNAPQTADWRQSVISTNKQFFRVTSPGSILSPIGSCFASYYTSVLSGQPDIVSLCRGQRAMDVFSSSSTATILPSHVSIRLTSFSAGSDSFSVIMGFSAHFLASSKDASKPAINLTLVLTPTSADRTFPTTATISPHEDVAHWSPLSGSSGCSAPTIDTNGALNRRFRIGCNPTTVSRYSSSLTSPPISFAINSLTVSRNQFVGGGTGNWFVLTSNSAEFTATFLGGTSEAALNTAQVRALDHAIHIKEGFTRANGKAGFAAHLKVQVYRQPTAAGSYTFTWRINQLPTCGFVFGPLEALTTPVLTALSTGVSSCTYTISGDFRTAVFTCPIPVDRTLPLQLMAIPVVFVTEGLRFPMATNPYVGLGCVGAQVSMPSGSVTFTSAFYEPVEILYVPYPTAVERWYASASAVSARAYNPLLTTFSVDYTVRFNYTLFHNIGFTDATNIAIKSGACGSSMSLVAPTATSLAWGNVDTTVTTSFACSGLALASGDLTVACSRELATDNVPLTSQFPPRYVQFDGIVSTSPTANSSNCLRFTVSRGSTVYGDVTVPLSLAQTANAFDYDLAVLSRSIVSVPSGDTAAIRYSVSLRMSVYMLMDVPDTTVYFTLAVNPAAASGCNGLSLDKAFAQSAPTIVQTPGSITCISLGYLPDDRMAVRCTSGSPIGRGLYTVDFRDAFSVSPLTQVVPPDCFSATMTGYQKTSLTPLRELSLATASVSQSHYADVQLTIQSKALTEWVYAVSSSPFIMVTEMPLKFIAMVQPQTGMEFVTTITYDSSNTTLCPQGIEFTASPLISSAPASPGLSAGSSLSANPTAAGTATALTLRFPVTSTPASYPTNVFGYNFMLSNALQYRYGQFQLYPNLPRKCFTVSTTYNGQTAALPIPADLSLFAAVSTATPEYVIQTYLLSKRLDAAVSPLKDLYTFEVQFYLLRSGGTAMSNSLSLTITAGAPLTSGVFSTAPLNTNWPCILLPSGTLDCPALVLPALGQTGTATPTRFRFTGPSAGFGSIWPMLDKSALQFSGSQSVFNISMTRSFRPADLRAAPFNVAVVQTWSGSKINAGVEWTLYFHIPVTVSSLKFMTSAACPLRFSSIPVNGNTALDGTVAHPVQCTSTASDILQVSLSGCSIDAATAELTAPPMEPIFTAKIAAMVEAEFTGGANSLVLPKACLSFGADFTRAGDLSSDSWSEAVDDMTFTLPGGATVHEKLYDVNIDLIGHTMTSESTFSSSADVYIYPLNATLDAIQTFTVNIGTTCSVLAFSAGSTTLAPVPAAALHTNEAATDSCIVSATTNVATISCTSPVFSGMTKFVRFRLTGVVFALTSGSFLQLPDLSRTCVNVAMTYEDVRYERPSMAPLPLPTVVSASHVYLTAGASALTAPAVTLTFSFFATQNNTSFRLAMPAAVEVIAGQTSFGVAKSATQSFLCTAPCTSPVLTLTYSDSAGAPLLCTPASPCWITILLTGNTPTPSQLILDSRLTLAQLGVDRIYPVADFALGPLASILSLAPSLSSIATIAAGSDAFSVMLSYTLPTDVPTSIPAFVELTFSKSVDLSNIQSLPSNPEIVAGSMVILSPSRVRVQLGAMTSSPSLIGFSQLFPRNTGCTGTIDGVCAPMSVEMTLLHATASALGVDIAQNRVIATGPPVALPLSHPFDTVWLFSLPSYSSSRVAPATTYTSTASFTAPGSVALAAGSVLTVRVDPYNTQGVYGNAVTVTSMLLTVGTSLFVPLTVTSNPREWTATLVGSSATPDVITLAVTVESTIALVVPLVIRARLVHAAAARKFSDGFIMSFPAAPELHMIPASAQPWGAPTWLRNDAGASLYIELDAASFLFGIDRSKIRVRIRIESTAVSIGTCATSVYALGASTQLADATQLSCTAEAGIALLTCSVPAPVAGLKYRFVLSSCVGTPGSSLLDTTGFVEFVAQAGSPFAAAFGPSPIASARFTVPRVATVTYTADITGTVTALVPLTSNRYSLSFSFPNALCPYNLPVGSTVSLVLPTDARRPYVLDGQPPLDANKRAYTMTAPSSACIGAVGIEVGFTNVYFHPVAPASVYAVEFSSPGVDSLGIVLTRVLFTWPDPQASVLNGLTYSVGFTQSPLLSYATVVLSVASASSPSLRDTDVRLDFPAACTVDRAVLVRRRPEQVDSNALTTVSAMAHATLPNTVLLRARSSDPTPRQWSINHRVFGVTCATGSAQQVSLSLVDSISRIPVTGKKASVGWDTTNATSAAASSVGIVCQLYAASSPFRSPPEFLGLPPLTQIAAGALHDVACTVSLLRSWSLGETLSLGLGAGWDADGLPNRAMWIAGAPVSPSGVDYSWTNTGGTVLPGTTISFIYYAVAAPDEGGGTPAAFGRHLDLPFETTAIRVTNAAPSTAMSTSFSWRNPQSPLIDSLACITFVYNAGSGYSGCTTVFSTPAQLPLSSYAQSNRTPYFKGTSTNASGTDSKSFSPSSLACSSDAAGTTLSFTLSSSGDNRFRNNRVYTMEFCYLQVMSADELALIRQTTVAATGWTLRPCSSSSTVIKSVMDSSLPSTLLKSDSYPAARAILAAPHSVSGVIGFHLPRHSSATVPLTSTVELSVQITPALAAAMGSSSGFAIFLPSGTLYGGNTTVTVSGANRLSSSQCADSATGLLTSMSVRHPSAISVNDIKNYESHDGSCAYISVSFSPVPTSATILTFTLANLLTNEVANPMEGSLFLIASFSSNNGGSMQSPPLLLHGWPRSYPIEPLATDTQTTATFTARVLDTVRTASTKRSYKLMSDGLLREYTVSAVDDSSSLWTSFSETSVGSMDLKQLFNLGTLSRSADSGSVALSADETLVLINWNNQMLVAVRRTTAPMGNLTTLFQDSTPTMTFDLGTLWQRQTRGDMLRFSASQTVAPFIIHDFSSSFLSSSYVGVLLGTRLYTFRLSTVNARVWTNLGFQSVASSLAPPAYASEQPLVTSTPGTNNFVLCQRIYCGLYVRTLASSTVVSLVSEFMLSRAVAVASRPGAVAVGRAMPWIAPLNNHAASYVGDDDLYYAYIEGGNRVTIATMRNLRSAATFTMGAAVTDGDVIARSGAVTSPDAQQSEIIAIAGVVPTGDGSAIVDVVLKNADFNPSSPLYRTVRYFFTFADTEYVAGVTGLPIVSAIAPVMSSITPPVASMPYAWASLGPRVSRDGRIFTSLSGTQQVTFVHQLRIGLVTPTGGFVNNPYVHKRSLGLNFTLSFIHPRKFLAQNMYRVIIKEDWAVMHSPSEFSASTATSRSFNCPVSGFTHTGSYYIMNYDANLSAYGDFMAHSPPNVVIPVNSRECSFWITNVNCFDARYSFSPGGPMLQIMSGSQLLTQRAFSRDMSIDPYALTLAVMQPRNCNPSLGATCEWVVLMHMPPVAPGTRNDTIRIFAPMLTMPGTAVSVTFFSHTVASAVRNCTTSSAEGIRCPLSQTILTDSPLWATFSGLAISNSHNAMLSDGDVLPRVSFPGCAAGTCVNAGVRSSAAQAHGSRNIAGILDGRVSLETVVNQPTDTLRYAGITFDPRLGSACMTLWGVNQTRCVNAGMTTQGTYLVGSTSLMNLGLPVVSDPELVRMFLPNGDAFAFDAKDSKLHYWYFSERCDSNGGSNSTPFEPFTFTDRRRNAVGQRYWTQEAPMLPEGNIVQRIHVLTSTNAARGSFVLVIDNTGFTLPLRIDPRGSGFALPTTKTDSADRPSLSSANGLLKPFSTQIGNALSGPEITSIVEWTDIASGPATQTSIVVSFRSGILIHYFAPIFERTLTNPHVPRTAERQLPLSERSTIPLSPGSISSMATVTGWPLAIGAGASGIIYAIHFPVGSAVGDVIVSPLSGLKLPCSVSSLAVHPSSTYFAAGCSNGQIFMIQMQITADSPRPSVSLSFLQESPTKRRITPRDASLEAYDPRWKDNSFFTAADTKVYMRSFTTAHMVQEVGSTINDLTFHPYGAHLIVLASANTPSSTYSLLTYHIVHPITSLAYTISGSSALGSIAQWTLTAWMPRLRYPDVLDCRAEFPPSTTFANISSVSTSWSGVSNWLTVTPPESPTSRALLQFTLAVATNTAQNLSITFNGVKNPTVLYDNLSDLTMWCATPSAAGGASLARFDNGWEVARGSVGTVTGMLLGASIRQSSSSPLDGARFEVGVVYQHSVVLTSVAISEAVSISASVFDQSASAQSTCYLSATNAPAATFGTETTIIVSVAPTTDTVSLYMRCVKATPVLLATGIRIYLNASPGGAQISSVNTDTFFVIANVSPVVQFVDNDQGSTLRVDPNSIPASSDIQILLPWNAPVLDANVQISVTSSTPDCLFWDTAANLSGVRPAVINIGTSNPAVAGLLEYTKLFMRCSQISSGVSVTVSHLDSLVKVILGQSTKARSVYGTAFLSEPSSFNIPINAVLPFTVNINPRTQVNTQIAARLLRNSISMSNTPCRLYTSSIGTGNGTIEQSVTVLQATQSTTVYIKCTQSFFSRETIDLSLKTSDPNPPFTILPASRLTAYIPVTSTYARLDGTSVVLPAATSLKSAFRIKGALGYALSRPTTVAVIVDQRHTCRFSRTSYTYSSMAASIISGFSTDSSGMAATGFTYTLDAGVQADVFYISCSTSVPGVTIKPERYVVSGDNLRWDVLPPITIRGELRVQTSAAGNLNGYFTGSVRALVLLPITLVMSPPWPAGINADIVVTGPAACLFSTGTGGENTIPTTAPGGETAGSITLSWVPLTETRAIRMRCPYTSTDSQVRFEFASQQPTGVTAAMTGAYLPFSSLLFNVDGFFTLTWEETTQDGVQNHDVSDSTAPLIAVPAGAVKTSAQIRVKTLMSPTPPPGQVITVHAELVNGGSACRTSFNEVSDWSEHTFTSAAASRYVYVWCSSPTSQPIAIRLSIVGTTGGSSVSFPAFTSRQLQPQGSFTLSNLPTALVAGTPSIGFVMLSIDPNVPQTVLVERTDTSADCVFAPAASISTLTAYATSVLITQTQAQFDSVTTKRGPIQFAMFCRRTHVKGPLVRLSSPTGSYVTETFGPYQVQGRMSLSFTNPTTSTIVQNITDATAVLDPQTGGYSPGPGVVVVPDPYFIRAPKTNLRSFILQMAPALSAQTIIRVSLSTIRGSCGFLGPNAATDADLSDTFQVNFYLGDSRANFFVACREATTAQPYLIVEATAGERYITALSRPLRVRGELQFVDGANLPAVVDSWNVVSFSIRPVPLPTEATTISVTDGSASGDDGCMFRLHGSVAAYERSPFLFPYTAAMATQDIAMYCRTVNSNLATRLTIAATNDIYISQQSNAFRLRGAVWIEDGATDALVVAPASPPALATVRTAKAHAIRLRFRPPPSTLTNFLLGTVDPDCRVGLTETPTSQTAVVRTSSETVVAYLLCSNTRSEAAGVQLTLSPENSAMTYYNSYSTALSPVRHSLNARTAAGLVITDVHIREPQRIKVSFDPVRGLTTATQFTASIPSAVAGQCVLALELDNGGSTAPQPEPDWALSRNVFTASGATFFYIWLRCDDYTQTRSLPSTSLPVLQVSRVSGDLFWPLTTAPFQTYFQTCATYSALSNGVISITASAYGERTYGTVLQYNCNEGYALNTAGTNAADAANCVTTTNTYGLSEVHCTQKVRCAWNGWSATQMPTCQVKTCASLTAPTHGSMTNSGGIGNSITAYNAKASFSCSVGYYIEGSSNITCTFGGWSAVTPQCLGVICPTLEAREGVDVDSVVFSEVPPRYTSTATYVCPVDYRPVNSNRRTCQADGTWDGVVGVCTTSTCSPLLYDTERMQLIAYKSAQGQALPPDVEYDEFTTATYSCKPGFVFADGDSARAQRTCRSKTWEPIYVPVCNYRKCPVLTRALGTVTQVPASLANSFSVNATLTCDHGMLPNVALPTAVWCTESGVWSSTMTTCSPRNCGVPPTIQNMAITVSTGTYGQNLYSSVASYRCVTGFNLFYDGQTLDGTNGAYKSIAGSKEFSAARSCEPAGWTPESQPRCAANICAALTVPSNVLSVRYTSPTGASTTDPTAQFARIYLSVAVYSCVEGYEPRSAQNNTEAHNATRVCRAIDIGWDHSAPVCLPYDCGEASEVAHMASITYDYDPVVSPTKTSFRSRAVYTCAAGFAMPSGSKTSFRTCLGPPTPGWSPEAPTCVDIDECDSTSPYFVNCASLYGVGSRCINTYGSYVCTPFAVLAPALEVVITEQQRASNQLNPELYPLPAKLDQTGLVVLPVDASGGQNIRFAVARGANLVSPYVSSVMFSNPTAAEPGLLDYVCRNVGVATHSLSGTGSYGQLLSVTCTIPPGQGMDLYLRVQYCYRPSVDTAAVDCARWNWNWDGVEHDSPEVSINSQYRMRYPAPTFVPSSLFSVTYDSGRTNDYVMPSVMGELVGFDIMNLFFDRPALMSMKMGEAATIDDYPYSCAIDVVRSLNISTVQRTLVCRVPDQINKANLRFRLALAGHLAYSTDQLSYPQIPRVDTVVGCAVTDGSLHKITGCSTQGTELLHVRGNAFIEPLTAFVHGRQCIIDKAAGMYVDSTEFYCRVPVGTGADLTFIVKASTQSVQVNSLLTYAAPMIEEISGCSSSSPSSIIDCSRQGGNMLLIRGRNFGFEGATVTVGGIPCTFVSHDASQPHRAVRCQLPAGTTSRERVVITQRYGATSTGTFLVSYVQCGKGTFQQGYLCQRCAAGEYNNRTGTQVQCLQCAPGTHSPAQGSTACLACPPGTYSPLGSAKCISCPRGTFSSQASDRCVQCVPGTYASKEGSTSCSKCGANAEQTVDYAYCQCRSGFYLTLKGECEPCMVGGNCVNPGTTVYTVMSLDSYSPSAIQGDVHHAVRVSLSIRAPAVTTAQQATVRSLVTKVLFDSTTLPQERVIVTSITSVVLPPDNFGGANVELLITPAFASNGLLANTTAAPIVVSAVPVATAALGSTAQEFALQSRGWTARNVTVSGDIALLLDELMNLFERPDGTVAPSPVGNNTASGNSTAESVFGDAYNGPPALDGSFSRRPVSSFQECYHSACIGGNQCRAGHTGNMCTVCEPGYGRKSTFTCEKCRSPVARSFYLTGSILAAILICFVLAYKQIVDGRKSTNELPAPAVPLLFKIGVSGIQVFAIASRYDVYWPGILGPFF